MPHRNANPGGEVPLQDRISATETILSFLRVEDDLRPADAIFVLGGSSLSPVRRAARLHHHGLAPVVAFTSSGGTFGGAERWRMPEAVKYHETLLALGVPETAILWEATTTDTLMEARRALPFLQALGIEPSRLILVARPVHQRRAWATFARQWPGLELVNAPGEEELHPEGWRRCCQELERLERYARQGDLVPQQVPAAVRRCQQLLRQGSETVDI